MSDSLRPHGLFPTRLLHPWGWVAISFSKALYISAVVKCVPFALALPLTLCFSPYTHCLWDNPPQCLVGAGGLFVCSLGSFLYFFFPLLFQDTVLLHIFFLLSSFVFPWDLPLPVLDLAFILRRSLTVFEESKLKLALRVLFKVNSNFFKTAQLYWRTVLEGIC